MRFFASLAIAAAFAAAPARAGDGDERERIVNDQSQVFDRLSSLKKRMERLAVRLDQDGRAEKAALLRKAIAEVDVRNLESRKDELLHLLGDPKSLQSHEKQEQLFTDLDAILKILLDEKDPTELDKQLNDLRQTRAELGDIRNAERALREKTEEVANDKASTLRQLADLLKSLLEKQQAISNDTKAAEAAQQSDRASQGQKQLGERLAQLTEQQGAVVQKLDAEAKERTGNSAQVLDQSRKAAQRGSADDLKEAARRVGEERSALGEKSPDVAKAMRDLESELTRAAQRAAERETNPQGATQNDGEKKPTDSSSDAKLEQSLAGLEQAVAQALAKPSAPNADASQKPKSDANALSELAKQEQALAPEAKELSGALAKQAEQSSPQPQAADASAQSPAEKEAAKALDDAAKKLADAQQGLEKQELGGARDDARDALAKLEEAQDALAKQGEAQEKESKNLAARQDVARAQTEQAKRDAQNLPSNDASSSFMSGVKKALEKTLDGASQLMQQATQALSKDEPKDAAPKQSEAEKALAQAQQQAEQAAQQAEQEGQKQDAAQTQEQMKKLAEEQRDIEEKLRELMQRMRDRKQKQGQEQGGAAQRAMNRAKQNLDDDDAPKATQSEREAEKNLDEMDQKLREDENKYENLRSEEMLFHLKEQLGEARKRAAALHDGIAALDADRAGAERLSHRLRPKAKQLSDDAGALKQENDDIQSKVAADASTTFPWVLDKNSADLGQVKERLAARDAETGEFVQVLAADVVSRYDRLLQSLDEELKRRQQQQQGAPPPGGGGQGKKPLVPPVAELLLLKHLEEDVLTDVRTFRVEQKDTDDPSLQEARLRLLERLGHRHSELTGMFDALVKQQTEPDPNSDDAAKKDEESGGDKKGDGSGENKQDDSGRDGAKKEGDKQPSDKGDHR